MRASIIAACVAFAVLTTSGCAVTRKLEAHESTPQIDDKVITSNIQARHAESTDLNLSCISVETLYGVVLLSGFVEKPLEKITAQQIAMQVAGVKAIHNEIIIQPDDNGRNSTKDCLASSSLHV